MEKIKLLLADDHSIIRDGIKAMLKNYAEIKVVAEVSSGNELVEYLNNNPTSIDIVLTDISMPDMNGIEATKIIVEKFPQIKVLALTMHLEDAYITNMIKAGAHGYILKNSNINELILAIKTVYNSQKYYANEVSVSLINNMMNKEQLPNTELSTREIEVLSCIADGNTNKEAGEKLFISPRTVETHRRNLMDKLNLKNTAEIVRYALKNKLSF